MSRSFGNQFFNAFFRMHFSGNEITYSESWICMDKSLNVITLIIKVILWLIKTIKCNWLNEIHIIRMTSLSSSGVTLVHIHQCKQWNAISYLPGEESFILSNCERQSRCLPPFFSHCRWFYYFYVYILNVFIFFLPILYKSQTFGGNHTG